MKRQNTLLSFFTKKSKDICSENQSTNQQKNETEIEVRDKKPKRFSEQDSSPLSVNDKFKRIYYMGTTHYSLPPPTNACATAVLHW